ncbi:hypothetical protein BH10PAT3_BH10PAT3_8240 [soil metagenome]
MTWPNTPHRIEDIPHDKDFSEFISRTTEVTIVEFIRSNHELLEPITGGNEKAERSLGSLLIDLAITTAKHETFAQGDRRPSQR